MDAAGIDGVEVYVAANAGECAAMAELPYVPRDVGWQRRVGE